jgi:hypothetical protein
MLRKTRKQENSRFVVKWIEGNTLHFREYKRDAAAVKFMQYLIEDCEVDYWNVRLLMK